MTKLPNGKTRMYVGAGDNGTFAAGLFRSDDATAAAPAFTDITTIQSAGYCGAQCWYDNVVYTPAGQPDAVYLGGSYDYANAGVPSLGGDAGKRTNGRAFIYSTDAGANFSDLTRDVGPAGSQDGMHPDQHAIAVSPSNSNVVFFGSDGGIMRSSGDFADISAQCDSRGLNPVDLADCKQLLSRVPTALDNLNSDLPTLQFQSLSVDPRDPAQPPGRHAGQRHLGRHRRRPVLEPDDLGRRRPVRLQRRRFRTCASTPSRARRMTATSVVATPRSGS